MERRATGQSGRATTDARAGHRPFPQRNDITGMECLEALERSRKVRHMFTPANPFTLKTARELAGKKVTVKTFDSGLRGFFEGEVRPLTRGTTFVGSEVLFNECIVEVTHE
jgi:hypothetical protein